LLTADRFFADCYDAGCCPRFQRYKIGLAIKTEEYVPTNTPTISAKAKVLISSPELERIKITKTTNRVVKDVMTVRLSDWLILRFKTVI
jgi:hypothetical protein